MTKSVLLFLLLSLSIIGCSEPVKKVSESQNIVFYQIFPDLIDTLHFDLRQMPFEIANENKKIDSLTTDTTKIVIAIKDTLEDLDQEDYLSLQAHINASSKALDSMIEDTFKFIDLSSLNANDKRIQFKTIGSFPKGLDFWRTQYHFYLSAKFYFSRILFNNDKTYGLLHVGYVCGPYQCGEGFRVFIKKEEENWKIDRIEDTWAM